MNLDLNEEQLMLKDSIEKFIQAEYSLEQRQKILDTTGYSKTHWQTFAELGWLSIPFEEQYGGFGGDMSDVAVVMEEFGKGLVLEPFISTLVIFGRLLQRVGSEQQKNEILPKLISGEAQGKLAYIERQSRYAFTDVLTKAEKVTAGYKLSGSKVAVPFVDDSEYLIVLARISGEQADRRGLGLFLVDTNTSGLSTTEYQMMDGQRYFNVELNNVDTIALLAQDEAAVAAIEATLNDAIIASSAEGLGSMKSVQDLTVEYSKVRKQFDVPIGVFQVLQHRMVDMFISCEQMRSMLYRTLCSWQTLKVDDLSTEKAHDHHKNIHALKYMLGQAGNEVAAEAVQLHGGMGMTEEMSVGHYLKRMRMLGALYGDADYHLGQFNHVAYN